jgi:hypothetical protein
VKRAIATAAALLGACSVSGIPGLRTTATAAAGADDEPAEARGHDGTKAGKLPDGIPGAPCSQEGIDFLHNEWGYDGPCWDPPGMQIAALMPTAAIKGRRKIAARAEDTGTDIWWFDIPEAEVGGNYCPQLKGAKEEWTDAYAPYDEGGFTPFTVGDLTGKPIADVLDMLDKLDLPVCVTVQWDTQCDGGNGKVCFQSVRPDDTVAAIGDLHLIVGSDVTGAGTPDEGRRYPEVIGRKLDDVLADLKARGFTNVKVVEDRVACERGIVCDADPGNPGFVRTDKEIQLTVRRAKSK